MVVISEAHVGTCWVLLYDGGKLVLLGGLHKLATMFLHGSQMALLQTVGRIQNAMAAAVNSKLNQIVAQATTGPTLQWESSNTGQVM